MDDTSPVTSPSKVPSTFASRVPFVIDKFPVDEPTNAPVPTTNLSADSSNPINALAASPLSITIPLSPAGAPVVPFPSSISLSDIVVLVVAAVVVAPLITKSPLIVTLFSKVLLPAIESANPSVYDGPPPNA